MPTSSDSETSPGPDGITPEPRADRGPEENSGNGVPGAGAPTESSPEAGGDGEYAGGPDLPEADDDSGAGGGEEGAGNQRSPKPKVSSGRPNQRITDRDIEIALKGADGNQALAARALGVDKSTLRKRLTKIPHLYALYGAVAPGKEVPVPTIDTTAIRSREDAPAIITAGTMANVVKETEKLIHQGLENFGVPKETLEKLRSLHGLAPSAGEFLAQSVMDVQDLYSIELYKIPAMLDDIRVRYLDNDDVKPMEKMFWQRAYTELLEQLGKGKDRMIAGAEAISAMMRGKDGASGNEPRKVRPAWGKQRSA